ncbi:hypothetical protein CP556_08490 [Natrinema sp. CBA1119]|uniref:hypothetical protein n=1 Tax=Natrinema sp. CBA1119 TaxID=1608465 RepID=UPI000BF85642|nr:hypothetical protein [Natrinema sp. CBA1119]PGF16151.1 hypothetical protein CP556_08490 [Natrinema sp. CBA1119]
MNRTISITLAAVLVVAMVAVPLAAASVSSSANGQAASDSEAGNESIKPGEQFAAAVGVQNAEIEGDVSERAFGVRIANAETNESKAAVVAAQFDETDARLAELEGRLEDLNESREAGEISEGRYRAEVATTVVRMRTLERQAATAETTATGLPDAVLASHDIDVDSIRTLRDRAGDLGGPETAEIAHSIAGDDGERSLGPDRDPSSPIDVGGDNLTDEVGVSGDDETAAESSEA